MGHRQVAEFQIKCPACEKHVPVAIMLAGITTEGLSLEAVSIYASVGHRCPKKD